MPTYIIERNIPGAAEMSREELQGIAEKSREVISSLGKPYTWVHSYVAGDKIYCVHEAQSEDDVREHARRGGFPADRITEISAVMNPEAAGASA